MKKGNKLIELVDSIVNGKYKESSDEIYKVSMLPGLKESEIFSLEESLGCKFPNDIKDLLKYTGGIDLGWNGLISFAGEENGEIEHEEVFPLCLSLRHDGGGNFCVVDIDQESGSWGQIYYHCHDPAVIMLHAKDLEEFLEKLKKSLKKGGDYEIVDFDQTIKIYQEAKKEIKSDTIKEISNKKVKDFGVTVDFNYKIVDFSKAKSGTGFYRGDFDTKIIRHAQKPAFIVEKKYKTKKRRQFRK